ncbi:hypothetical protein V8G54_002489 [Vigna mungo]|uniref:non-specific serine/threonine protein kinase n=1 Tax=Vigna mungo TaxID=3915 RepID=A0AAQ3PAV0_VIGMU
MACVRDFLVAARQQHDVKQSISFPTSIIMNFMFLAVHLLGSFSDANLSYQHNKTTNWFCRSKTRSVYEVTKDATWETVCFLTLYSELFQMARICRMQSSPRGGLLGRSSNFRVGAHFSLKELGQPGARPVRYTTPTSRTCMLRMKTTQQTHETFGSRKKDDSRVDNTNLTNLCDDDRRRFDHPQEVFTPIPRYPQETTLESKKRPRFRDQALIPCQNIKTIDALKEITSTMGATNWEFDSDYCSVKMLRSTPDPPKESERRIDFEKLPYYWSSSKLLVEYGEIGDVDVNVMENDENVLYVGDGDVLGSEAAKYYINHKSHWGFSSTGDFMDDGNYLNAHFTRALTSSNLPELYQTARVAPLSLTYFLYCLENGKYTVKLHFAEIQFTNDKTYSSLGKRLFDIYIQEKLVRKDFNIEDESHGPQKPLTFPYNVSVTENILEIRFYWAGKGTTRVPGGGAYGPLISALSIVSRELYNDSTPSKPCSEQKSARRMIIVGVGFGVTALCLVIIIVGIFLWNGCFKGMIRAVKGTERQDSKMGTFTLEQIREATEDFSPVNKIGEGGFGPVYKGQLSDGTLVAVKQLSSKSRQGNREFLNEIGLVSCLHHPNLVKLHGCCIEGNQLMLVYEYMENNSLAQALFSSKDQLNLDWPTRLRICIGIAKGLAFLHEESRLKIVHRDIKATNVLLDGNLNPKISDFGLARLDDEEKTHITTRIAGTIGYMAPEYALWGRLSYKADVYSYGVVVLEVVSGKSNNNYMPSDNRVCLLDKACHLQRTERLIELVDERLGSKIKPTEAIILMKVALLCTDVSPSFRPTMSEVVNMLEGRARIPDKIPQSSDFSEDIRFKSMRDIYQQRENHSLSSSQLDNSTGVLTLTSP